MPQLIVPGFIAQDFTDEFVLFQQINLADQCFASGDFVEAALARLITQYREATNLKALVANYVAQVEQPAAQLCTLPLFFDIETATGDQLTLIGKRLGWPRCHCVCVSQPVFGFACEDADYEIAGFCEPNSTWVGCGEVGQGELCLHNDDLYRLFLKVRRYQILGLYDVESLSACIKLAWGSLAGVSTGQPGTVILMPGRQLTDFEEMLLPLWLRVLPVAPGIRPMIHFGPEPVFGFGEGWGGFCETPEAAVWQCPEFIDPYSCN